MVPSTIDTAVAGAGPAGCLAAMNLAQKRGEEVLLLEADTSQRNRFAGEWLHPAGIAALGRGSALGLDEIGGDLITQRGFVIFPDDAGEPVVLDYPGEERGLVFEHTALVNLLRRRAIATPGVRIARGAKVTRVKRGELDYRDAASGEIRSLAADRIVGADGRGSLVRPALGLSRSSQLISYMAGVVLRDVELPFEGYGHVILGAPGPILLYRISPGVVRASIDVPAERGGAKADWAGLLRDEYLPFVPESIRPAFVRALAEEELAFRANRYRPRTNYGDGALCLVGDAVGFQHPLTAMGMTLGFQDAEGLASHESFAEFQRERRAATLVPELLAMALYQAFSGRDPGAREVRRAIYAMWRRFPVERERTMLLLSGKLTSPVGFGMSFFRGVHLALAGAALSEDHRWQWTQLSRTLGSIGQIMHGLLSCSSTRLPRGYGGMAARA